MKKRFYAALIDYGIISIIIFLIAIGVYTLEIFPLQLPLFTWAVFTVGVEQFYGATIGNYLQNLKPISIRSQKKDLTFGQSLKRHLIDIWDMWPFGILGYLFIKNTKYNQRLGDLWAKTIVIDTTDSEQGVFHENKEQTTQ